VEHLIESRFADLPWPVVAGARGYYRPTAADDLNRYRASLRSRAIKDFQRAKTLMRKALAAGFRYENRRFVGIPQQQDLL
jgi:hypothetical protein